MHATRGSMMQETVPHAPPTRHRPHAAGKHISQRHTHAVASQQGTHASITTYRRCTGYNRATQGLCGASRAATHTTHTNPASPSPWSSAGVPHDPQSPHLIVCCALQPTQAVPWIHARACWLPNTTGAARAPRTFPVDTCALGAWCVCLWVEGGCCWWCDLSDWGCATVAWPPQCALLGLAHTHAPLPLECPPAAPHSNVEGAGGDSNLHAQAPGAIHAARGCGGDHSQPLIIPLQSRGRHQHMARRIPRRTLRG
jgi:hypothetical protein